MINSGGPVSNVLTGPKIIIKEEYDSYSSSGFDGYYHFKYVKLRFFEYGFKDLLHFKDKNTNTCDVVIKIKENIKNNLIINHCYIMYITKGTITHIIYDTTDKKIIDLTKFYDVI